MKHYEPHPFAEIFPLGEVEGPEWEEFKKSVGDMQREPIILYEGKILDGRRRYRALTELGVKPRFGAFPANHWRDALDLSYEKNMHRRDLDPTQRGMVRMSYKKIIEKEAAERKIDAGREAGKRGGRGNKKVEEKVVANLPQPFTAPKSRDLAAEAAGISPRTMQDVVTVCEKGIPELQQAAKEGKVAASAAATVAKLPPAQQKEIVSRGPKAVKEHASKVRKAKKGDLSKELLRLIKAGLIPKNTEVDVTHDGVTYSFVITKKE